MKKNYYSLISLLIIQSILLCTSVVAIPVEITVWPVSENNTVNIDIRVDSVNYYQPIFSFEGGFTFDPAVAIVDTLVTEGGVIERVGLFAYSVDSVIGGCSFAYARTNPIPASGLLFTARMALSDVSAYTDPTMLIDSVAFRFNEGDPEACISFNYPTDVSEIRGLIRRSFRLQQNYPNPFNPSTTIRYNLERKSYVELSIYNICGKKVRTLISQFQNPGEYSVAWDGFDQSGSNVASGIYFCRIEANGYSSSRKMVMLK